MAKNWTEKEIDYLARWVGLRTVKHMARYLKRSEGSIQNKINRLGLTSKDSSELLTTTDFCEALNVPRATVEYWHRNLDFPSKKIGKYRMIDPVEFWRWAEVNKRRVNWSKVPHRAFGVEPDWVNELRTMPLRQFNHSKPWTDGEIAELKWLVSRYSHTLSEMAVRLNRSEGAIRRKLYDLKIPHRPMYVNKKRKYSDEEIQLAVKMRAEGRSIQEISEAINGSAHYLADRVSIWEEELNINL